MSRIAFSLPLPATELLLFSSFFFPFHSGYLSLPVLLALCLQPPMCSLEKWLMGLHGVQCVSAGPGCAYAVVCVLVSVSKCVCPSVCTEMSLGCVIEMEMSQSAAAVVCHLSLHSLHCPSSAKLTPSVWHSAVWRSVLAKLGPSIITHGPEEVVWKCNQAVITIMSLHRTDTCAHALCPADFPGFVLWPTSYWASCGITKTCNYHHLTISLPSKFAP